MSRWPLLLAGFAMVLGSLAAQEADAPSKSMLETKKKGWIELVQNQGLWTRVPLGRAKLAAKNPWRFEEDDTLSCAGAGVHEMFLYSPAGKTKLAAQQRLPRRMATQEAGRHRSPDRHPDGTAALDGLIYHEALFGNKSGGYFVGTTVKDGKNSAIPKAIPAGPTHVLEAGEWNICEITSKDKTLSCWVNGYVTGEFIYCDYAKGQIGVKVDNANVEFRKMQFLGCG